MRNSTWMLNCGSNTIFKFFGAFFENTIEEGEEYSKQKYMVILFIHLFAIFSLFFSSYIILISSFFIVLFSIFSYAFMSEYSGPAAYTLILDGSTLGSPLLGNVFLLGFLSLGAWLFLIPSFWTFAAAIFIPIILAFKKIGFLLFGYIYDNNHRAYSKDWFKKNIKENWVFLIFEILLLHSIAVRNYYPVGEKGGGKVWSDIMIYGFGAAAPAGALIMLAIKELKNRETLLTLIVALTLVYFIHEWK